MGYNCRANNMKKITLVAMTLLCSVAFTNCAAKKPVKSEPQKSATELEIERLKQEKELRALRAELEKDSIERARQQEIVELKHQHQIAQMESQHGMQQMLEGGVHLILTPCMDEFIALNKEPNHMAAQGISTGQSTQEAAELNANRVGISDITTRLLGVIKNGVEQYSKDSSVPSGKRSTESQLEGLAAAIGEQSINKLYSVDCRQFAKDRYNQWICYEALFVPVSKVLDEVTEEAVRKLDVDKALFRKHMEEELESNRARENASLEKQRAEINL